MRLKPGLLVAGAFLVAAAGCAQYEAQTAALSQYPGIQQQITSFYDDHATEDDWSCNEVEMLAISRIKVARQDASSVTFAVHYDFQPLTGISDAGVACEGFNTRFFTFGKGQGNDLSLERMSGPQRS